VRVTRSRGDVAPSASHGQPGAAFAPARGKDGASGSRAHPMAEAMHLRAMTDVRLVGPLPLGHGRSSLLE
jgi:hypothetical protein